MESNGRNLCNLAHNLNNKLAVILGCCDLLSDDAEIGTELAKRLRIIQKAAHEMARQLQLGSCPPTADQVIRVGTPRETVDGVMRHKD